MNACRGLIGGGGGSRRIGSLAAGGLVSGASGESSSLERLLDAYSVGFPRLSLGASSPLLWSGRTRIVGGGPVLASSGSGSPCTCPCPLGIILRAIAGLALMLTAWKGPSALWVASTSTPSPALRPSGLVVLSVNWMVKIRVSVVSRSNDLSVSSRIIPLKLRG